MNINFPEVGSICKLKESNFSLFWDNNICITELPLVYIIDIIDSNSVRVAIINNDQRYKNYNYNIQISFNNYYIESFTGFPILIKDLDECIMVVKDKHIINIVKDIDMEKNISIEDNIENIEKYLEERYMLSMLLCVNNLEDMVGLYEEELDEINNNYII